MKYRYAGIRHDDGSSTLYWYGFGAMHSMHYQSGVFLPAEDDHDIVWLKDISLSGPPAQTHTIHAKLDYEFLDRLERRVRKLEQISHTHVAPMMPSS